MLITKRDGITQEPLDVSKYHRVIGFACDSLNIDPLELEMRAQVSFRNGMSTRELTQNLIKASQEMANQTNTEPLYVAARLLKYDLYKDASISRGYHRKKFGYGNFLDLVNMLTSKGLYGKFLKERYTDDEVNELGEYIDPSRDELFTYAGLRLLSERYIVRDYDKNVMELPQERFMAIAMHLAMKEKKRMYWAKQFYDILSNFYAMTATPTLMNGGRPHHQLSSCFEMGMDDDLWSIFDVSANAAMLSKFSGGLGIYLGKIRGIGSSIRGVKNASGGVMPWAKILNDIAVAVDQLGLRKGGIAAYLDIWHSDVLHFMAMRKNNGDTRYRAHNIFPALCVPDLFMEQVKKRGDWYLFDPNQVRLVLGYSIEDYWGEEFEEKFWEVVNDDRIDKTVIPAMEIMREIVTSSYETGTPFIFFRDLVNAMNPNKHCGMIYCTNLC